jgi:hypothetical protein
MNALRRTIHPECKVLDEAKGLIEYIASDESLDSFREIIRADGWRFNRFTRNAPFVDSHNYSSVDMLLGRVVDFKVAGTKLVETVQWAIDVEENQLARLGWKMTVAGYLRAVSVGFIPIKTASRWQNATEFSQECSKLNLGSDADVRCIYLEHEQIELSACIIGANANALAKAHKADVLSEADLETFSTIKANLEHAPAATDPADAAAALQRARLATLLEIQTRVAKL